jgi:hypothetical protein
MEAFAAILIFTTLRLVIPVCALLMIGTLVQRRTSGRVW